MKEQKYSITVIIFLFCGSLFIGAFALFILINALNHEYPDLIGVAFGCVFGLIALTSLFLFLLYIIKPQSFDIETKKCESNNKKKENPRNIFIVKFGLLFIGLSLSCYLSFRMSHFNSQVTKEDLYTFNAKLIDKPEFGNFKGNKYLSFKTKNYPKFDFRIGGVAYYRFGNNLFLSDFDNVDTLSLTILKSDFNKKLVKTEKLTASEKYVNYDFITIYGIYFKGTYYSFLEDFNNSAIETNYHNRIFFLVLFGIFLFFIIRTIVLYIRNK